MHNNKAPFGGDAIVVPTNISNANNDTVEGFVSRLGTDASLLNVTLRTTGAQGLPSEHTTVHAILDGLVVTKHTSRQSAGWFGHYEKKGKPPGK